MLAAALLPWLRWPISRYHVSGPSMEPAYHDGDRVLVNRLAYVRRAPAPGEVVVIRDPSARDHYLLKRIARAPEGLRLERDGYWVLGDNAAASRDSRAFGAVRRREIVGKAWLQY